MIGLPIQFPSELDRVRRNLEMTKDLTPTQRVQLMDDFNQTLFELAGGRDKVLKSEARLREREEWRRIMIEFMQRQSGREGADA